MVIETYRDISLVVVAQIDKKYCMPEYLKQYNAISQEELDKAMDSLELKGQWMKFETENLEFLRNEERIQLSSKDSLSSNRLSDLAINVLQHSTPTIKAVGVNATLRFAFTDKTDYDTFINRYIAPDRFSPFSNDSMVVEMTFIDRSAKAENNRILYNVVRLQDNNGLPVVQITLNNQHNTEIILDAISYLEDSARIHMEFFRNGVHYMNEI